MIKNNTDMKDIVYNVKNEYSILNELDNYSPWGLFDKLGELKAYCPGITSPQMVNVSHCKQSRETYELFKFRKAGKTPTFKVSKRRGYHAIVFSFTN